MYSIDGPVYIIAELGCNHQGDINIAFKLIEEAKKAGVNCVKMQKRDMDSLNDYSKQKIYDGPNSFGKTYYEHRKALELSMEDMQKARDKVKELGMDFSCSCWDKKSIDDMYPLVDFYKLQSADSSNNEMVDYLISKKKPIVASIGGSTIEQAMVIIEKCREAGVPIAILHTTPIYPCPFNKINLNNIQELIWSADIPIGYSGHEKGIAVSEAAVALGAKIIERHQTFNDVM
jgi:N-acetylneuraminate synthase/sialic acid synthase